MRPTTPYNSGGKADPGVTGAGKPALLLTGCCTWEHKPCTSSGQHIRADPIGEDKGEPALKA